jgi:hypothetical protein
MSFEDVYFTLQLETGSLFLFISYAQKALQIGGEDSAIASSYVCSFALNF